MDIQTNDTGRIQVLNDFLRKTGLGGQTFVTKGILSLSGDSQRMILDRMRAFSHTDSG